MSRWRRDAGLVCALSALLAGCATSRPPLVDFSETAKSYRSDDYLPVFEAWTRHAKLVQDIGTAMEVWATFKSWDFRQAYVAKYAKVYDLADNEREPLAKSQQETARAVYGLRFGPDLKKVDRNEVGPEHFKNWAAWAGGLGIGMDFNPTYFSHPLAASGFKASERSSITTSIATLALNSMRSSCPLADSMTPPKAAILPDREASFFNAEDFAPTAKCSSARAGSTTRLQSAMPPTWHSRPEQALSIA